MNRREVWRAVRWWAFWGALWLLVEAGILAVAWLNGDLKWPPK